MLESKKWNNTKTIELHREKEYDIIDDGDRRVTEWPKTWETAEPIVEKHMWTNRTLRSSVMNFREVSEQEIIKYKLMDYPDMHFSSSAPTILDSDKRGWGKADQYWRYVNGILGPMRKLRIWVLIFHNQPYDVFCMQEGYWKKGNKNEYVICIGIDSNNDVTWSDVFGWTEKEALKIETRDYITQKMKTVNQDTLIELAKYEQKHLIRFVKPEFTKKFAHLAVQPTLSTLILVAFVILLINIGIVVWIVKNDHRDYGGR